MTNPTMNRRGFLRLFGGGAVVATVAPTYFFAPVGGWRPLKMMIGSYADYLNLSEMLPPQELLKTYYDKRFIANLMEQTPMILAMGHRPLPAASNRIVTFMSPRVQL